MANYHKLSDRKIRLQVIAKYDGRCAYCGIKFDGFKFEIDHIEPLNRHETDRSKRGASNLSNYNPACTSCNSSKNCMTLEFWRSEIEKKIDRINRDSSTYRLLKRFGLVKEKPGKVLFYFEKMQKNG
jgi:5-methylcytosine-specific restriction endonuclease McrA